MTPYMTTNPRKEGLLAVPPSITRFWQFSNARVLREEVESLATANPNVEVETAIPSNITVKADQLLHQLFSNLLGNAVAHNDVADLEISVQAERDGAWATIEIADNGSGIPPELRERIFELGEQGSDSDGDGIGLYLVSRLAEIYGGSVEVDEASAGGALFQIKLPTTST